MRKTFRLRHDGQTRANNVAAEHSTILDTEPGVQTTRLALGTYVADVDGLFALQQRSLEERRAATVELRKSRGTLRNAARAVAKIGTLVDPEDDVLTMGSMHVPGGVSDDELIAYTRGLIDRVTPHADVFVKAGLPSNLLKNLADAIQQFARTKDLRDATVQRFQSATESIRETQAKADKAIDAIEAVALNLPAANPEFVRMLRIARRVGPRTVATPEKPAETPEKPTSSPTPPSNPANKVA